MTNRPTQGWVNAAILLTAATMVGGCSWFGGGRDDASPRPIAAETTPDTSADTAARPAEDDRRTGLVARMNAPTDGRAETHSARPVSQRTPLVLAPPSTAPAASVTMPEYVTLGSVVANVNGTPIYAHELVKQVTPVLKARARDLDEKAFRQAALRELTRQRSVLVRDELEYAAAQRNTTADERRDAQARTFAFRDRMVSRAGGSIEAAKAKMAADGEDFDKALANEERRNLVRLYYVKKVFPRVTVTVDEMRRYYEQNRESKFTVPTRATIRLIRIDPREVGSPDAAMQQIDKARARAASGENFDALSDEYNKMPFLIQAKGKLGPISPGAYAIKEVDAAIWQTDQGKVTDVIKSAVDGALYVALIEEKTQGRTMSFEEQEVQDAINGALRESKMSELQQKQRDALARDAVVQADDAMLQPVLEMTMQMYPTWRSGVGD